METRFESSGSLPAPGPIGRLVRLGWGALIVWGVWNLHVDRTRLVRSDLPEAGWVLPFLLALWLAPPVVNIGWRVEWGMGPRWALAAALPAGVIVNRALTGTIWSPALGWLWLGAIIYVLGHLGISFLLAAVLATPGCEMRALPHLWSVLSGRQTPEHYCPGHIDAVDAWERRLRGRRPSPTGVGGEDRR